MPYSAIGSVNGSATGAHDGLSKQFAVRRANAPVIR
jgi:hypothetical protein